MKGRIPTLDGWRAIAALAVIVCHFAGVFWGETVLRYGALGVDFFFGMSGMLITSLLLKEIDRTGSISFQSFYRRRFFRIVPACTVFVLFVWSIGGMRSTAELLSSLFFFRNYLHGYLGNPITNHLWTLAVEMHFYLLWPALLLWVGIRRGLWVAASLAVVVSLFRMNEAHVSHTGFLADVLPVYRTDLRLDFLLWGCVLGFLMEDSEVREKLRRLLRFRVWLGLALLYCLMVVAPNALTPALIPLLIAGTVLHKEWVFSRFLETSLLKWLGKISYSLYIWQQLIFLANRTWPAWVAILMIPLCSLASYYLVELPAVRLGRGRPVQQPVETIRA